MEPTGYVYLYSAKGETKHCNVTGLYGDYKKEGWSIWPDQRDINGEISPPLKTAFTKKENVIAPAAPAFENAPPDDGLYKPRRTKYGMEIYPNAG